MAEQVYVKKLPNYVVPPFSFTQNRYSVPQNDTSVQQKVSFRCRVNKRFVFGSASTNGSFSEARQQTARFRWRLNKQVKSFFDIFKLISDS